ncbi:hypothetical protein ACLQ25_29950 [Micromonospora sp. DT44]|uniref:SbtR family transcriptional regulator n=1 Tax=Micromonospora sp. DT44 TaxID=3393439 RepID=UPI003CF7E7C4
MCDIHHQPRLACGSWREAVLEPQANKRALGKLLRGAPTEDSGAGNVRARVERCIDQLLQRGREQRVIRADVATTDIGVLMSLMAHLIETFGEANPRLWRRLLPILLDGPRADAPTSLPEQPLNTSAFLSRLTAPP